MYVRLDLDEQLDRVALGAPLDMPIEALADVALDDWFERVERAQSDAVPFLYALYALPALTPSCPRARASNAPSRPAPPASSVRGEHPHTAPTGRAKEAHKMPQHSERPSRAQILSHLHEVEQAALTLTGIVEYGLLSDDWETRAREAARTLRVLIMDRPPMAS